MIPRSDIAKVLIRDDRRPCRSQLRESTLRAHPGQRSPLPVLDVLPTREEALPSARPVHVPP